MNGGRKEEREEGREGGREEGRSGKGGREGVKKEVFVWRATG